MPLDVTPEAIADQVMAYIESHSLASGLIILVDMGSLNAIHSHFNRRLTTPVAIINNVSTGMAMYVGERILQGDMLDGVGFQLAACQHLDLVGAKLGDILSPLRYRLSLYF